MFSFRSKTRQRGKFDAKVISNQNFHRSIVIPESVLWKVATKRKLSCIRQTLQTEIKHCICTLPSNFLEHLATIRQMQHFFAMVSLYLDIYNNNNNNQTIYQYSYQRCPPSTYRYLRFSFIADTVCLTHV